MKTNDFTLAAAKKAGIPKIEIHEVKFMGTPQNGSMLIYGAYPDGTHYENTVTGEFADIGTNWEDHVDLEIANDEDDNVIGYAVIKCKEWL